MPRSRLLACPHRNHVEAKVAEQALDNTSHETACLPRDEVWIWNTRLAALSDTRLLSYSMWASHTESHNNTFPDTMIYM